MEEFTASVNSYEKAEAEAAEAERLSREKAEAEAAEAERLSREKAEAEAAEAERLSREKADQCHSKLTSQMVECMREDPDFVREFLLTQPEKDTMMSLCSSICRNLENPALKVEILTIWQTLLRERS